MTSILICVVIFLLVISAYALYRLHKIKQKSIQIISALEDIQNGNLNRRILATDNDFTDEICYKINEIGKTYARQQSQAEQAIKTNKQIMTSISHDIRTPLTTLMGYLDAVESNITNENEKRQYIKTAQSKAHSLKNYTDDLFEWFKIQSNEKKYNFEEMDINELSRGIIIDWIPQFEKVGLGYEIDINDSELPVLLDVVSYNRIINNILLNAINHSKGTLICFSIQEVQDYVVIIISDNGNGIVEKDLPYVFNRLYKGDDARTTASSGLGLSIIKELVNAQDGAIFVDSTPHAKTTFTINMKKAR